MITFDNCHTHPSLLGPFLLENPLFPQTLQSKLGWIRSTSLYPNGSLTTAEKRGKPERRRRDIGIINPPQYTLLLIISRLPPPYFAPLRAFNESTMRLTVTLITLSATASLVTATGGFVDSCNFGDFDQSIPGSFLSLCLSCQSPQPFGGYIQSELDLNNCIGNNNGTLQTQISYVHLSLVLHRSFTIEYYYFLICCC